MDDSRQRILLSNGRYGAEMYASTTSPTDAGARLNPIITTATSVGLSPIQNNVSGAATPGFSNFNIQRVKYEKDLDAELKACNDIINKLQGRQFYKKPDLPKQVPPVTEMPVVEKSSVQTSRHVRTKSQLEAADPQAQQPPLDLPSEPSRIGGRSEMINPTTDLVSQSWVEALNDNKMNIQEADSFHQIDPSSMRNSNVIEPATVSNPESKLVPPLNVGDVRRQ